jgi:hypothetical protein
MIEDENSVTGSGVPEFPEAVILPYMWESGASSASISPEYSSCSGDDRYPTLFNDGAPE